MAVNDYLQGQGIHTFRDNDVKVKLVDGQSGSAATRSVSIVADADTISAGVNDSGIPTMVKCTDGKHREMLADALGHPLVAIVPISGTSSITDYLAHTGSTGSGATLNATPSVHDKTITTSKTAMNIKATVASTGLVKWDLGTYDGTLFTIKKTVITSPARPSVDIPLSLSVTAPGTGTLSVHLVATNLEPLNATDGYSTLEWTEM